MTTRRSQHPGYRCGHIQTLEQRTLFSGGLDPTFGTGGVELTTIQNSFQALVSQPNRNLIAGSFAGGQRFSLYRFTASGATDATFGSHGVVTTSVGTTSSVLGLSILLQTDGKLLAAAAVGPSSGEPSSIEIFRFNTNGSLDKTFGSSGMTNLSVEQNPSLPGGQTPALLLQNGKILVDTESKLVRLNSNGTVDSTFHFIDTTFNGNGTGASFALQSNLKILVDASLAGVANNIMLRFNADGTPDTTFGTQGQANSQQNAQPVAIVVEPNGTIVENGTIVQPLGSGPMVGASALTALNSNGTPDTAFGTHGIVTISASQQDWIQPASVELFQQPNGQLLATDSLGNASPPFGVEGVKITRFSANGVADTTFGTTGAVTLQSSTYFTISDGAPTNVTEATYTVSANAALDSSGRLVLAGFHNATPSGAELFAINTNSATGSVAGYMFYDFNGNGKRDPGDHALNWTCYIDVDNDGKYDNADIKIYTNKDGTFTIGNLAPGVYHIRQSQVAHWQKTSPAEYTVTVSAGETVSGVIFSSREIAS